MFSISRAAQNVRGTMTARHNATGRGLAVAGGVALVGLLAGCGATTISGSATATLSGEANPAASISAAAPSDTTVPGSGAGTSAASSPATQAAAGAQSTSTRCHTADMSARVGADDPGAGQVNFPIVLTNTSGHTCTVYGFPGLGFTNAAGTLVTPAPTRTSGTTETVITLAPGQSAWAGISFGSPEISGAQTVTPVTLLVTPPDETTSIKVPWTNGAVPASGNSSTIRLMALQSGSGV